MPLIDDIKENTAKMKGRSFKDKVQYFIQYYGVTTIVIIAVGFFLFSIIKTMVTAKDTAFQAIMINAYQIPSEEEFAEYAGIDLEEYDVMFDNSYMLYTDPNTYNETAYTTAQKLMAVVASGTADVMLGDKENIESYMSSGFFGDLRDFLDEKTIESFGNKVIMYQPLDEDTGEPVGEEIPVVIEVTGAPGLDKNNCFTQDHVYFAIIVNSSHPDYCKSFLDFIYEK